MDYQSLHMKTVVDLKKLAKQMGVRVPAGTNKQVLIELLLEADRNAQAAKAPKPETEAPKPEAAKPEAKAVQPETTAPISESAAPGRRPRAKAAQEARPEPARRGRPLKNAAEAAKPAADRKAEGVRRAAPRKQGTAVTADAPKPVSVDAPKRAASGADPGRAAKAEAPKAGGTESKVTPAAPRRRRATTSASAPSKPEPAPATPATAPVKPEPAPTTPAAAPVKPEPAPATPAAAPVKPEPASATPTAAPTIPATAPTTPATAPTTPAIAPVRPEPAPATPAIAPPKAPSAPAQREARPTPLQDRVAERREGLRPGRTLIAHPGAARQNAPEAQRAPVRGVTRGLRQGAENRAPGDLRTPNEVRPAAPAVQTGGDAQRVAEAGEGGVRGRREGYYNAEYRTSNPAVPEMLAAGECSDGAGVLEIQPDGYGFLRAENCLPGPNDVYISIAQIRRFNLREGDYVVGKTRPQREGDRYSAMMYILSVNGEAPEAAAARPRFEDLVPIYPDQRLRLEPVLPPEDPRKADLSLRLVDMMAPIGKGQRGMIVSQPKAGKTTLLKKVANAITDAYPKIELIVLLIDERPEEVTDMKRSIKGEVIYSTFDEAPENHVRVSEMVLARAQRLVEMGRDVVVLMDSITRLARAYNLVITPTGRSLSGGLDPGALFKPKRFFGAARNIENGGSLTVIATALVETGSRMDDIIYEEFKGTGNMELHLDRKLSDKRVFPAIDLVRSGTRREELLLTEQELDGETLVRRILSGSRSQEMTEQIIDLMSKTDTNARFFEKLKGWIGVFEKEGFTFGGK